MMSKDETNREGGLMPDNQDERMKKMGEAAYDCATFMADGVSPYHVVANAEGHLHEKGFQRLREQDAWDLRRNGKYYVTRNGSSLVAFVAGEGDLAANGFRFIGAHTDSPGFKLKPDGTMVTRDGYIKAGVEAYGGAILSTWFDRPLGVAGRAVVRKADGRMVEELIDLQRPLFIIPNLAIHFNRDVNSGYAYNKQIDCIPLMGLSDRGDLGGDFIRWYVEKEAGLDGLLMEYDLFLYEYAPAQRLGAFGEFISSGRVDNLSMAWAGMHGLCASPETACGKVLALFDNEEVGSRTPSGADSSFLMQMLQRLSRCYGTEGEGFERALANSIAVSADCAHAIHPNYPEKHDPVTYPVMGKGIAVKYSASQRYMTNARTAAHFENVCQAANVNWQRMVNRSDMIGGSTIGPSLASLASMPTVDVGIPILAMHSIRELCAIHDVVESSEAFAAFYASAESLPD